MIFSVLFNGLLHQPGEGGEHVDGRVDLLVVKLPVNENLSLSDVTSQVRNGMSDVIILNMVRLTGMDKMGIWVIDPFLPRTRPALS